MMMIGRSVCSIDLWSPAVQSFSQQRNKTAGYTQSRSCISTKTEPALYVPLINKLMWVKPRLEFIFVDSCSLTVLLRLHLKEKWAWKKPLLTVFLMDHLCAQLNLHFISKTTQDVTYTFTFNAASPWFKQTELIQVHILNFPQRFCVESNCCKTERARLLLWTWTKWWHPEKVTATQVFGRGTQGHVDQQYQESNPETRRQTILNWPARQRHQIY